MMGAAMPLRVAVLLAAVALTGVVGRLTRKGTQARLILAVNLIGQGVSVQVDAADVRAL